jgi:hypothetical protein
VSDGILSRRFCDNNLDRLRVLGREQSVPEFWPRGDLYQATAFAAAYRYRRAAVVSFQRALAAPSLPAVSIGDISVTHLTWNADDNVTPEFEESAILDAANKWLNVEP